VGRETGVLNAAGSAWGRLAADVAGRIPVAEVDGVWVFRAIRHETREFGTAIISRVDGDRRRIYTARYVHTLKGRERGQFASTIEEVGSGPVETLDQLMAGVRKRLDDEVPEPVAPEGWFGAASAPPQPADGTPRDG
jgi:hypothetical protein